MTNRCFKCRRKAVCAKCGEKVCAHVFVDVCSINSFFFRGEPDKHFCGPCTGDINRDRFDLMRRKYEEEAKAKENQEEDKETYIAERMP